MTDDDQAPASEIPAEQLEAYLRLWATAWTSGYVSAYVGGMQRVGMGETERRHLAIHLDHRAAHQMQQALNDPVSRTVIVDMITEAVTGTPVPGAHRGELPITCTDPNHNHGG